MSFLDKGKRSHTEVSKQIEQTGRELNRKKYGREERWIGKIRIVSTTPELRGELRWLLSPRILKFLSEESYRRKNQTEKWKSSDWKSFVKIFVNYIKLKGITHHQVITISDVSAVQNVRYFSDMTVWDVLAAIVSYESSHTTIYQKELLQTVHYILN